MQIHRKTLSTHLKYAALASAMCLSPQLAMAQESVFSPGWVMNNEASALRFQSVKNETKVESSTFATYIGSIDEAGLATVRILLDSVDTNVDLRNVRMRFLMFETFRFPEAVVTMQIDPESISDLQDVRRKVMTVPYTLVLHGVTSEREAEIAVTLLDDDRVSVTSATPISLPLVDFGLMEGMNKLEEAAKVDIIPSATVTFDFTFDRAETQQTFTNAMLELADESGLGAQAALEVDGDFSLEACKGRLEILSLTNRINFGTNSAALAEDSTAFLDSIAEIISRCPDLNIQVAGHTDSDGDARYNQTLSEARANAVLSYLVGTGIEAERVRSVGFGEATPLAPNDTAENKRRNRRIEFSVVDA